MPVSIGEDDYLVYRHRLGEALKESGCALHAYVLKPEGISVWHGVNVNRWVTPGSWIRSSE